MIDLSVLIVNYKTGRLTRDCIAQLKKSIGQTLKYEVVVVDNNSGDDSRIQVTRDFPEVVWVENPENSGFGSGMNLAMTHASGGVYLLLNSDVLVTDGAVEKCYAYLKDHEDVGGLGCKLTYPDGSPQKSVWYNAADYRDIWNSNLLLTKFGELKGRVIKALMGSFLMIPSQVVHEVGPFDSDFFMYSEEMELCHRIRKAGYRLQFLPEAKAVHTEGASSDGEWAKRQKQLSNVLLYRKLRGTGGCILFLFLKIVNSVVNICVLWLVPPQTRKSVLNEMKIFYSGLGRYLTIPVLYSRKRGNGKRQLKLPI